MRSWRKGSVSLAVSILVLAAAASGQSAKSNAGVKKAVAQRANELTLAGLRPGKDAMVRARQLNQKMDPKSSTHDKQTTWLDPCHKQLLAVDFDDEQKIQVIRAAEVPTTADCIAVQRSAWKTGRGLRVGDSVSKLAGLYGEPDSRSPSTKGGQPLELWYYAFDWAGADVPQVMEVLCTVEAGQPGRVVEITLAAPSL
jgi:hypothetical protein